MANNAVISSSTAIKARADDAKKQVTILHEHEATEFEPMIWPIMDNGQKEHTNALGYKVPYWYQEQILKKLEAEDAEREEKNKAAQELLAQDLEDEEQEETEVVKELTAEELEKIRAEAYEEGKKLGYEEGYKAGSKDGYDDGFSQGLTDGNTQGQEDGFFKGHEKGFTVGKEEGFLKGQELGLQNGEEIVKDNTLRLQNIIDALSNPLRAVNKEVTDELVYILSRLCSVLLKREVSDDVDFLADAIKDSLSVLPNAQKGVNIVLNPDDLSLILANIPSEYISENNWSLSSQEDLERGDVIVSNDISSVSWKINDRIDSLLAKFLQRSNDAVEGALTEHIEGVPDYNVKDRPKLAPSPKLVDIEDVIVKNTIDGKSTVEKQSMGIEDTDNTEEDSQNVKEESLDESQQLDIDNEHNLEASEEINK